MAEISRADETIHPALFCEPVRLWFERRFAGPTEPQLHGWPIIASGQDTLIAAPTGSGKTLAAFLVIIDRLVRRALAGELEDQIEALYVSPLRALSHDIQKNLERPLAEIREVALELGLDLPEIRSAVRTGDTPPSQRQAMLRRPPHILVTTPESFFLLLTAEKSRPMLATAKTLIVDEIHALARDKRGSHLSLSLARFDALCEQRPARVGLSATQRPLDLIAGFLAGKGEGRDRQCRVIDLGHQRDLKLSIEVPDDQDLGSVATHEQWEELQTRLSELIAHNRTTLIFTNTRRLAERLAHQLGDKIGAEHVAAHHGSLSKERRLKVEGRLRAGELKALVATASLELGIDIGTVDLVCQIGSPRGIATFLQRVGRSGHALGLVPHGCLFPTSRDELGECAALIRAVRARRLDAISLPRAPLDILAQQIVAACAVEDWDEQALFELVTRAAGYEALKRSDFDAVIEMLAKGIETPKGRRAAFLHRDRLQQKVSARRGARIAALTSGGAIPEVGDYRVLLDPAETFVGTVNEDWAIESMAGDIFLLGTHSWKIRRVESGVVRVVDAEGAPPTIPFWLGEAPARTAELSQEVSALRTEIATRIENQGVDAARDWVAEECALAGVGAQQLVEYIQVQLKAIGCVPTCDQLVAERFFDDSGGMQLVIHSPLGGRINRGFGLALRKRFCGSFNQELQAAATDDAIVLSLGNPQTFPLDTLPRFLSSKTIDDVLTQAMLDSPMFTARWRWTANRSLAVLRSRGGKRVPFPLQRMQADDLLAGVFPDLAACQENVTFPIDIPDHPLVNQVVDDCLHEACDVDGLRSLIERIEDGSLAFHTVDTVEPSPFAHEILNARPYAFLDDAPLEERRTRAVSMRHVLPEEARDLGRLDSAAIATVREEAAPLVRDSNELYELLVDVLTLEPEKFGFEEFARELVAAGRAAILSSDEHCDRIFALERVYEVQKLFPEARMPALEIPAHLEASAADLDELSDQSTRAYLSLSGPITTTELAVWVGRPAAQVEAALIRLEARGIALRGKFEYPERGIEQWCDRSLLARIHRYTLSRLRKAIEPVSARDYLAFLLRWQHVHPDTRRMGEGGLLEVIQQLSGFEAAAAAWESDLLTSRVDGYKPELLDSLCLGGAVAWGRLRPGEPDSRATLTRATPISLFPRSELEGLLSARDLAFVSATENLSGTAQKILDFLAQRGALFFSELEAASLGLPNQLDEGLRQLIARGVVTCDAVAPLRRLLVGAKRGSRRRPRRGRGLPLRGVSAVEARWTRLLPLGEPQDIEERCELTAWRLLNRYGVVFRDVVAREWVPEAWRGVHRALRRLEARGLVRGGRFVTGFLGEQFALPEAVPILRQERSRPDDGRELIVSASDPLNLAGILTPGPRVPAGHTRSLVFRGGLPVAVIERGRRVALDALGEGLDAGLGAAQN